MGNCISQPTSTRSDRQVQRKPSRQVDPISISRVNKGDDSTHHSDALPTSGSAHLLELPEDNVTNLCHSNVDNEGYKAMLACHDKLVTALATDYLSIAGVLLAHGFVSEEVFAKMLLPSLTPTEKATVVVTAVRERIKNAPQNFPEVVKIFSEHTSTTCVVNLLQSSYRGESNITSHIIMQQIQEARVQEIN